MSQLVVVAFNDKHKADEVVLDALKQDATSVEGVEDAVVLVKDETGKIRVKPYYDLLSGQPGVKGEFWGTLISTLLTGYDNEVHDRIGVSREAVVKLREMLEPNSSAIFVLRLKFNTERLIDLIQKSDGQVLFFSLAQDSEQKLLEALAQ